MVVIVLEILSGMPAGNGREQGYLITRMEKRAAIYILTVHSDSYMRKPR